MREIKFKVWLKELAHKMLNQDNKATAFPMFCVMDKEMAMVPFNYTDGSKFIVFDQHGTDFLTDEETKEEFIEEILCKFPEIKEKEIENMNTYEMADFLETYHKYTIEYYNYVEKEITSCFTFTSAQNYLEQNRHNLKNPYIYVRSYYRNYEMIKVIHSLLDTIKDEMTEEEIKQASNIYRWIL